jgi:hypothetical protein
MAIPAPSPGLVIRYDYLWSREHALGRPQARKDRPACVVVASDNTPNPKFVVLVPITHMPPEEGTAAIEIPVSVRQAIGLDDEPAWIVVSEYNIDEWPNAGLAPIPGTLGVYSYGFITPGLFAQVKERFIALAEQRPAADVRRNP